MDFKIGDDIEDMSNGKKKDKGITPIIIVVVGALIIGLVVFLISSLIFKGKEPVETPPVDQQLNIADATVQVLYNEWLCSAKHRVKESTLANYRLKANNHILPVFGSQKISSITTNDIYVFIDNKQSSGLSNRYIIDILICF